VTTHALTPSSRCLKRQERCQSVSGSDRSLVCHSNLSHDCRSHAGLVTVCAAPNKLLGNPYLCCRHQSVCPLIFCLTNNEMYLNILTTERRNRQNSMPKHVSFFV
jgi:hypothetical protein